MFIDWLLPYYSWTVLVDQCLFQPKPFYCDALTLRLNLMDM